MKFFNLRLLRKVSASSCVVKCNFLVNHYHLCTPQLVGFNYQRPFISPKCESVARYQPPCRSSSVARAYENIKNAVRVNFFMNKRKIEKLGIACYRLTDHINVKEFYSYFEMEDSFNSWFRVLELHVWMMLVYFVERDKKGLYMRDSIIKSFWCDIDTRLDNLGMVNKFKIKKQYTELNDTLLISLWVYDDGLFGSDSELAGALWFKFFEKKCPDPRKLEVLVRYVRCQIQHLFELDISTPKSVENLKDIWLPLKNHIAAVEGMS